MRNKGVVEADLLDMAKIILIKARKNAVYVSYLQYFDGACGMRERQVVEEYYLLHVN